MTYSVLKATTFRAALSFYPFLVPVISLFVNSKKYFQEAIILFQSNRAKVHRRLETSPRRADMMTQVVDSQKMSTAEIESTFNILTVAGSDTVATLLTSMTSRLLSHPPQLHRLVSEIRSTFLNESDITIQSVDSLPYLTAVISESLRLDPPIPCQNPRVVPDAGDTICGSYIQGGTFVSISQFSMNRSPQNFAHPEAYIPERWLSSPLPSDPTLPSATFAADYKSALQPFSVGPRACIGSNFAHFETKLIICRLLWAFDLEADSEIRPFEEQKIFTIWERRALMVRCVHVTR